MVYRLIYESHYHILYLPKDDLCDANSKTLNSAFAEIVATFTGENTELEIELITFVSYRSVRAEA